MSKCGMVSVYIEFYYKKCFMILVVFCEII